MEIFKNLAGFEWDAGNRDKSALKHRVTNEESEEVFFDPHKRIIQSVLHSSSEERHVLLGRTREGRFLAVVFTMRGHKVRVISARDLSRRERKLYEEADPSAEV